MARGVNKVILIGNLGVSPEVRYTPNGNAVANVSLATTESWRDKQTGDVQDRTEWHRIVFFNRLAEIVGEYLNKGSKIYVEGNLRTRKWQDRNGVERYTTEIIANEMHMLDSRGTGGGEAPASAPNHDIPADAPTPTQKPTPGPEQQAAPAPAPVTADSAELDDDIPF